MIKLKINKQYLNFTDRQGKVRFEVFPFKFVKHEIWFEVQVTCLFSKFVGEIGSAP